ncbi:MAG TPA: hypothetical protein VN906_09005, partial [Candidatus Sulfotelmatobacter sp.]|nr:hypothetical protein [Candidatus Sulfotelmatobacter sp.]
MSYDPRSMRHRMFLPFLVASSSVAALFASMLLFSNPGSFGANSAAFGGLTMRVAPPVDNQNHLYVLDGWGGVHPVGKSAALTTSASWPTRDIAFSLALVPDGTGGYVMDGWGGLHELGAAPKADSGVYWPGWIGAREVVMAPWSSIRYPAGYLLDADGGIHPFGGAPGVTGNATWPAQGNARGLVLTPDSTPSAVKG